MKNAYHDRLSPSRNFNTGLLAYETGVLAIQLLRLVSFVL
jgi:hypothetical protein